MINLSDNKMPGEPSNAVEELGSIRELRARKVKSSRSHVGDQIAVQLGVEACSKCEKGSSDGLSSLVLYLRVPSHSGLTPSWWASIPLVVREE